MKLEARRSCPADADVLAVPVLPGRTSPGAQVSLSVDFLEARGFEGRVGEVLALLGDDGSTVLAVGVGDPDTISADTLRKSAAAAVRAAGPARHLALTLLAALPAGQDAGPAAQAMAEGAALAGYAFTTHKSTDGPARAHRVTVVGGDRDAVARGARVARAVILARDLTNEPPGTMTPRHLAAAAQRLADEGGLVCTVWDEGVIAAERLGGLAGVARGSDEPARLIRLVYEPDGAAPDSAVGHVVLVGKGVTFDSGGLSIKSADGMMTMKQDMGGGAVVLAVMSALADLRVPVRVTGIVPATENLPGPRAIKPGDVLRFRNGKTAEVLNTDAEGRLILADGLSLAAEAEPDAVIDLATLTGAVRTALGTEIAGLMGTSEPLCAQVEAASARADEAVWRLPLPDRYRRLLDSDVADMKNIGPGTAGALLAGLFLREFVGDVPWAHLDIAGPAWADAGDDLSPKGATGFGVRMVLELLASFEPPPGNE